MPLEATMIIIDNSEYMRNGDYQPTRFDAQKDAVTTVFQAKVDSNPENLVGLMTMAGKGPEVLATNTKDLGHILGALHTAASRVGGLADISTAISVSQLALKHRQNKNLRQRVVVFVGSPLSGPGSDEASLVKLAKKLKKNSVNVDIVAFGEGADEDQSRILRAFVETVSQGDSSHLVVVPPGPHLLSELLNSSPILAGDRGIPDEVLAESTGTAAAGAAGGFEFGVDPSLDPELAMALRMSMEEEQARQAAAAQASSSSAPTTTSAPPTSTSTLPPTSSSTSTPTQLPTTTTTTTLPADPTDDEEEAMLKQAIALSQAGSGGGGEGEGHDVEMGSHEDAEGEDDHEGEGEGEGEEGDEDMTEEEAIARAIEMSMKDNQGKQGEKK